MTKHNIMLSCSFSQHKYTFVFKQKDDRIDYSFKDNSKDKSPIPWINYFPINAQQLLQNIISYTNNNEMYTHNYYCTNGYIFNDFGMNAIQTLT